MDNHSFVFVTGLHRSGTSPLYRCLRRHPQISGFHNTGVAEDEGQHLQTVVPGGGAFGGPGRFAKHPDVHMTEEHPLARPETAEALFAQWRPYWDLSKPYLVEKTPINLTRTRLFQALFPNAYFLVLIRHPIPVVLSTYNALASWGHAPELTITDMIENWVVGYERFTEDAPHLKHLSLIRYEDFAQKPQETMDTLYDFLGLPRKEDETIYAHANTLYHQQWWAMRHDPHHQADIERAMQFEERVQRFGYSLREWSETEPPVESMLPSQILETERLILRRFTFADIDDFADLCADPETMRFWGGVQSRETTWWDILIFLNAYQQTGYSFWAIVDKAQNRFIGRCGLQPQDIDGQQETELGYQIARPYWGHGLATEAAIAVKEYIFANTPLQRLISIINPANTASIRVAQKNGMHHEKDTQKDGNTCHIYAVNKAAPR